MSEMSGDQNHPATPARREQARREGDFAKSHELAAAVQMVGSIAIAYLLFRQLGHWVRTSTTEVWTNHSALTTTQVSDVTGQLSRLIFSSLSVLVPLAALIFLVGVASHWCQTGPVFLSDKISPDANRMAPSHWFKRLFSISTLAFPVIGLPKAILAGGVMMTSCWFSRDQFYMLGNYPVDQMLEFMFGLILKVCSHVALALLVASLLDYAMKYLSFQNRIKMTDQQLRDELRMQNGDPQIAAQRRQLRQLMRSE